MAKIINIMADELVVKGVPETSEVRISVSVDLMTTTQKNVLFNSLPSIIGPAEVFDMMNLEDILNSVSIEDIANYTGSSIVGKLTDDEVIAGLGEERLKRIATDYILSAKFTEAELQRNI